LKHRTQGSSTLDVDPPLAYIDAVRVVVETAPFIAAAKAAGLSGAEVDRIVERLARHPGAVFLLTVFAKGERADLTKAESNVGDVMSQRAFDKIRAGLEDAIAIGCGEADPASYRVHVPAEVDVKAIRRKLGMSQARFAASFGFALDAVQNWEQGRRRPEGAARAFLKVIDGEPDAVRRALAALGG
jgi:putative transcriptional regulator